MCTLSLAHRTPSKQCKALMVRDLLPVSLKHILEFDLARSPIPGGFIASKSYDGEDVNHTNTGFSRKKTGKAYIVYMWSNPQGCQTQLGRRTREGIMVMGSAFPTAEGLQSAGRFNVVNGGEEAVYRQLISVAEITAV